jgi:hypothetical protein
VKEKGSRTWGDGWCCMSAYVTTEYLVLSSETSGDGCL